jgi:hypothetical protein
MITTEFYEGSGLGNQLWMYTVPRLVAEKRGLDFGVECPEKFKGQEFMRINYGMQPVFDKTYTEKNEIFEGNSMWPHDPNIWNVEDGTKLEGNFQSYQYLYGNIDKVRSWFDFKRIESDENACLIHFRAGDYKGIPEFLPKEYYTKAMSEMLKINPNMVFRVVSDEPELASTFLGLPSLGGVGEDERKAEHHLGGDVGIDFGLLAGAKYLIIPNSSFSWWAAFLNTRKVAVIAPLYWAGYNKGYWQTKDIKTDGFIYV